MNQGYEDSWCNMLSASTSKPADFLVEMRIINGLRKNVVFITEMFIAIYSNICLITRSGRQIITKQISQ